MPEENYDWSFDPSSGVRDIDPVTVDVVMEEFPEVPLEMFLGMEPLDLMADLVAEEARLSDG